MAVYGRQGHRPSGFSGIIVLLFNTLITLYSSFAENYLFILLVFSMSHKIIIIILLGRNDEYCLYHVHIWTVLQFVE